MIVTNAFNEQLSEQSKLDWLSYWKHFSKDNYEFCAESNCTQGHHHGVLVKQERYCKEALFVVPLCKHHSDSFISQIEIDERANIIPTELTL